jgi:thymidylate synthase
MRIYDNCYDLISEMMRDLWEMGQTVKPNSMQNKDIRADGDYYTKEIQNYVYTLTSLQRSEFLFVMTGQKSKDWADMEFEERVDYNFENPGHAWEHRSEVWSQFLNEEGKFDYTYNQRIRQSLQEILYELSNNPDTRQTWMPIFNASDTHFFGGKRRIPCSLGYFFQIRQDQVNMTYIQRSADLVTHLGNDIYLAWQMMDWVARYLHRKPGYLTHMIFSLHSYAKDWPVLEKGLSVFKG